MQALFPEVRERLEFHVFALCAFTTETDRKVPGVYFCVVLVEQTFFTFIIHSCEFLRERSGRAGRDDVG